ncbi:hypothetical protein EI94DRAFT_1787365 [Lactarius quietus]|nr:hypothetical protein EI94DRAFT_1787365 [Lactarius quietus]
MACIFRLFIGLYGFPFMQQLALGGYSSLWDRWAPFWLGAMSDGWWIRSVRAGGDTVRGAAVLLSILAHFLSWEKPDQVVVAVQGPPSPRTQYGLYSVGGRSPGRVTTSLLPLPCYNLDEQNTHQEDSRGQGSSTETRHRYPRRGTAKPSSIRSSALPQAAICDGKGKPPHTPTLSQHVIGKFL